MTGDSKKRKNGKAEEPRGGRVTMSKTVSFMPDADVRSMLMEAKTVVGNTSALINETLRKCLRGVLLEASDRLRHVAAQHDEPVPQFIKPKKE